jgi:hypothetical protein
VTFNDLWGQNTFYEKIAPSLNWYMYLLEEIKLQSQSHECHGAPKSEFFCELYVEEITLLIIYLRKVIATESGVDIRCPGRTSVHSKYPVMWVILRKLEQFNSLFQGFTAHKSGTFPPHFLWKYFNYYG